MTGTTNFAKRLIAWQKRHGRHDLPWQATRDPYRIWVSEIMLQQTRVTTVIPYFTRFMEEFPDLKRLARADPDRVLALWAGLGYYARGRNLHRAARLMLEQHGGRFPRQFEDIATLPGVGRSTAAAIAAFAFGERRAILDGNVKRVLARFFGIEGYSGTKAVENALWERAEFLLPARDVETYTQALMDLGATVCLRRAPLCGQCPVPKECAAFATGRSAELPAARPRKTIPLRDAAFLALLRKGEVMLEKRPPTGVWGGLWCLPELPPREDAADYCARQLGVEVVEVTPLAPVEHGFTHFRLRIHPQVARVRRLIPRAEQPGRLWLDLEDISGAALPAPMKKLLQALGRT
ncbi:MAG: A/G-specific adenine glycosylase [Betaproteobacteria bacterium]|nr:A/G-specific adenine glycosylase [Betaproteobacteria bacterium]